MKKEENPFNSIPLTGWYPGHMLKAGRQIKERLNLVDLVVELRDARIPQTSRNPAFSRLIGEKPRCLVLTKADLADPAGSRDWSKELNRQENLRVFLVDATSGLGINLFLKACLEIIEKRRRQAGVQRVMLRPPRLMVVGIPNVGKSTLINRLAAHKKTEVGPRPGVTRSQQWVKLRNGMELLDTPGVLWPRIEDKTTELKLALAGTIKDELVGEELLAEFLLWWSNQHDLPLSFDNLGIENPQNMEIDLVLRAVAERRGLLAQGGSPDTRRAAIALLHDFRAGKLGRATIDVKPGG